VVKEGTLRVQATNSAARFEGTANGTGMVGHAGAALLRELADQLELTTVLGWPEEAGRRRHRDAHVLRDLAVMLADGGDCMSDLAVLRDQPELFGLVASTPTASRVVERTATDPDGLARLPAAQPSSRSWSAPTAPGAAPGSPGTCASGGWGSRWACGSTPTCARRSWPSLSMPGP
jgi:hypothetical protein